VHFAWPYSGWYVLVCRATMGRHQCWFICTHARGADAQTLLSHPPRLTSHGMHESAAAGLLVLVPPSLSGM
jgi:hypothetical protein